MGKRGRRTKQSSHVNTANNQLNAKSHGSACQDASKSYYHVSMQDILALLSEDKTYLRLRNACGTLPLEFYEHADLQELRILSLRDCRITSLAPQISRLKRLMLLDIRGNPDMVLPAQLVKCNLNRFVFTSSMLTSEPNPYTPFNFNLSAQYCGDKEPHVVAKLTTITASLLMRHCTLQELDDLRAIVPEHLEDELLPTLCAECGATGKRIVATRVRNAVVAFQTVPLHYTLCSPICLQRLQDVWKLEELLNEEKRALRSRKFGMQEPLNTGQTGIYA